MTLTWQCKILNWIYLHGWTFTSKSQKVKWNAQVEVNLISELTLVCDHFSLQMELVSDNMKAYTSKLTKITGTFLSIQND